jgi:orotidine-5'-phosphate decarboxylase
MNDRLIVALDQTSRHKAERMVELLNGTVNFFKVGPALFLPCGPSIVEYLKSRDLKVFLDLKLHDIPNTVARAAETIAKMGVDIFNIHASGGSEMMSRTVEAVDKSSAQGRTRPLVFAVTVLTSLKDDFMRNTMGSGRTVQEQVTTLARLAKDAGCDGVVASAWEIEPVKQECGSDFLVLTPGIRPKGSEGGDQKRTKTPADAIKAGSDFIVVGRPITQADNPRQSALGILEEVENCVG